MFKFLFFLIATNVLLANGIDLFCEIENKFCGAEKHVACDTNVINYTLVIITINMDSNKSLYLIP